MKKSFTLLLCLVIVRAYAQHINLSGSMPELAAKKLTIQYLDHFKSEIPVDANGKFSVNVTLDDGYYLLKEVNITVYLESDMSLSISKNRDQVIFEGKGSEENILVNKLIQLRSEYFPLKKKWLTSSINFVEPDDFLNKLSLYRSAALGMLNNNTHVSAYFKQSQVQQINYWGKWITNEYLPHYGIDSVKQIEASKYISDYLRTGRTDTVALRKYKQVTKDSHTKTMSVADSAKLDVFRDFDMNNELAYRSSEDYRTLVKDHVRALENKLYAAKSSLTGMSLVDKAINTYINNPVIQLELKFQYVLDRFRVKRGKDQAYQDYIASATNKDYINDIKTLYWGTKSREGSPSVDFNFSDANGAKVSLTSLRGNYVYVDLWATYCVSCIVQMPSLKSLEKKYEGKNIRFVSVSEDRKKDEAKWKKFLVSNKMSGTQLIAYGNENDFYRFFKVSYIPRFILIDPNGVVVSEEALRPDEPALQTQLDKLLTKN